MFGNFQYGVNAIIALLQIRPDAIPPTKLSMSADATHIPNKLSMSNELSIFSIKYKSLGICKLHHGEATERENRAMDSAIQWLSYTLYPRHPRPDPKKLTS